MNLAPRKISRHDKTRHPAWLLLLVAGLGLLSCQSSTPTNSDQPASTNLKRTLTVTLAPAFQPDSVRVQRNPRPADSTTFQIRQNVVSIDVTIPNDLAPDTLWVHFWTAGFVSRSYGFGMVEGAPKVIADRRSSIAQSLLETHQTRIAADSSISRSRASLLEELGRAIAQGDPKYSSWSTNLPRGLSIREGDSCALRWLVTKGISIDSVEDTWFSTLDSSEAAQLLRDWLKAGLVTREQFDLVTAPRAIPVTKPPAAAPTINWLAPRQDTSVSSATSSLMVRVSITDTSSLDTIKIAGILITSAPYELAVPLSVGANPVVVYARNQHGRSSVDTLVVQREKSLGDTTPPIVKKTSPLSDTTVAWESKRILLKWNVSDDSLLASVLLTAQSTKRPLTGASGLFEAQVDLLVGINEFVLTAQDLRGNTKHDTLRVTRSKDAVLPTITRVSPTRDTILSAAIDSIEVKWRITDNDAVDSVFIQGKYVRPTDTTSGVYTSKVPLLGDSTRLRVLAKDASGNLRTDSLLVRSLAPPKISPSSRGLSSPQILSMSAGTGVTIEYSRDAGTTWQTYQDDIAPTVSQSSRILARTRSGDAYSANSMAEYAFPPSYTTGFRRFLGADTARWIDDGADSIEASLDGTKWTRADSGFLVARSGQVFARSRVGQAISPVTSETIRVHTAKVTAGIFTTFVLLDDNTLWAMGRNEPREDVEGAKSLYGDGSVEHAQQLKQIQSGITLVSPGTFHTMFMKTDGSVWGSGWNNAGMIGNGTVTSTTQAVPTFKGNPSAGGSHTIFVDDQGIAWASGYNASGQLGDGTRENRFTPVRVLDSVKAAYAAGIYSLFLRKDNSLWGTGSNALGQLGLGSAISEVLTPRKIMENVDSVSAVGGFCLVRGRDGKLWGLGSNDSGQFGTELPKIAYEPLEISLNTKIKTFSGSDGSSTLILTESGVLLGAGANPFGQLGRRSDLGNSQFREVARGVESFSVGQHHTLFVQIDGSVWVLGLKYLYGFASGFYGIPNSEPIRLRLPD